MTDWSFTSSEGPVDDANNFHRRIEYHRNYLNYGGSSFQLVPTERNMITGAMNYRGHTFQLWDEGVPTPYALHYRHAEPDNVYTGTRADSLYLTPPAHAPKPMFDEDGFPNSGLTYGFGPFDAPNSRGKSPYQLWDRDMHHYTITRTDHPMMRWDADADERWFTSLPFHLRQKYDLKTPAAATKFAHPHVDKMPEKLQRTTPRIEAMYAPDPVQATVMPPDTTARSRLISRGESKIAAHMESAATAKAELIQQVRATLAKTGQNSTKTD